MRFIDMEVILPMIRHLLTDLETAQTATLAEADPKLRAKLIEDNQPRWTALRDAFEEVSFAKCWYTECKSPGADNDFDHFRPKGKVYEDRSHPGYYWLAFDWRNMRLSCQRANRPRKARGAKQAGGKSSRFPLLPTGVRARGPADDLGREQPALLDPTNPLDHVLVTFRPNGEADLSPEFRGDAAAEIKFKKSQLALHINWPKFVEDRQTLYNLIERTIERGRREAPNSFEVGTIVSDAFKDVIRDLRRYMDQRSAYSAAARVYIESFRDLWWVDAVVLKH